MTDQTLPPLRTTHTWRAPGGMWCYDMWGRQGRPVVFLPAVLFDRVMWWPIAADLRPYATAVAVDLPGHGASTGRDKYQPEELVDDLAELIRDLGATQAPVLVGHASSAPLATLFAARYATHAVVTVDAPDGHKPAVTAQQYLNDMQLDAVPAPYRDMITPSRASGLLRRYSCCMNLEQQTFTAARTSRLAVYSQPSATAPDQWRHEVYDVPGRFAHLADVTRFVRDIRDLL